MSVERTHTHTLTPLPLHVCICAHLFAGGFVCVFGIEKLFCGYLMNFYICFVVRQPKMPHWFQPHHASPPQQPQHASSLFNCPPLCCIRLSVRVAHYARIVLNILLNFVSLWNSAHFSLCFIRSSVLSTLRWLLKINIVPTLSVLSVI